MTDPKRPWNKAPKRSMLEIALDYARKGWFIFPAPPGQKMSCVSGDNTNGNRWGATVDPKEIKAYFTQFPHANIGIAMGVLSHLWVSEADTPEGHNVDGIASLRQLEAANSPLPDTLIGESPSGSLHYFWLLPEGQVIYNSTSLIGSGIDVLGEGGMVIAPPSIRPGKGAYKWLNAFPPVEAPEWLFKLAAKQQVVEHISGFEAEADPEMIAAAMAAIPNDDIHDKKPAGKTQREYNNIGMACWRASGGSQEGFEAFDAWARKSKKYHGGTRERWKHYFKSPPTSIGAGTIFYLAQEADPNWRDNYMPGQIIKGAELAIQLLEPKPLIAEAPSSQPSLQVPGLVGEIADWITTTALYPQPALSLGAALTIIGTAAGRHIAGPTRSGTHLYIVGIARTGAGKNHPLVQIGTILTAVGMGAHVGPSQFISMPAVINFLVREPLSVCAMDEFGAFLKRVNNKRASGFEGAVSSVLRMAWGNSFSTMTTPEWAALPARKIESPAMSIFGTSTAGEFYASLEGADIVNGILNRFLIIETQGRPKKQEPLDPARVPESIVYGVREIYSRLGGAMNKMSATAPSTVSIAISQTADKIWSDFAEEMHAIGDKDEEAGALVARTAEIAMRLATIVTIGRGVDCIESDTMLWARDFARWSSDKLAISAGLYIADSEHQAMANEIRRVIKRLSNGSKKVKHSDVVQALKQKYKSRDLKDALDQMIVGGAVQAEKSVPDGGGTPTIKYRLA